MVAVERVTLRLPQQQVELLNSLVSAGEFPSKSEAIRAAVRELVDNRYNKLRTEKERFVRAT
jgi:antitoxin ParD1/3/4